MSSRAGTAIVVALALLASAPTARAETPPDSGMNAWIVQPARTAVADLAAAAALAWSGTTALLTAPTPTDYLPERLAAGDRAFIAGLAVLGLQLAEIEVGGGYVQRARYHFVAAREPSAVDLQHAQARLQEFRDGFAGPHARALQRTLQATIDVAGDAGFLLNGLDVALWPWPSATYDVAARNRPPEAAERRVIDALGDGEPRH